MTFDFTEVTARDVSRHFGRRRALIRCSLHCGAGEIVGLLGPNGAGKSTLLALLATLIHPSAGEIRYGAATAAQAGSALRGRIGLLGHDLYLYPELTARENLEFFARLYGLSGVRTLVAGALDRAGLADRAHDLVSSFSRGMRQRLALERALLHAPRLLLLDEPFTGLDDASGQALVARLAGLRDAGHIVVLATHDLELAEGLFDRVALLRGGRLHAIEAGPATLRERYRNAMASAVDPAGARG